MNNTGSRISRLVEKYLYPIMDWKTFITRHHAVDAIRRWEENFEVPAEKSTLPYLNAFYQNKNQYLDIYECDIDEDGKDERVIVEVKIQEMYKIAIYVEKLNANKCYYIVCNTMIEVPYHVFQWHHRNVCVIEIDGHFFIVQITPDSAKVFWFDASQSSLVPMEVFDREKTDIQTKNRRPKQTNNYESLVIRCSTCEARQIFKEVESSRGKGIGGLGIATRANFFERLHSVFNFRHSNYTDSESDVIQGLKDLSWLDENHFGLYIWDFDKMMYGRPESKARLIQAFEQDIIPYWAEQESRSFTLYLVSENKQSEQAVGFSKVRNENVASESVLPAKA